MTATVKLAPIHLCCIGPLYITPSMHVAVVAPHLYMHRLRQVYVSKLVDVSVRDDDS